MRGIGAGGADDAFLTGATFYRLRGTLAGADIANADEFIRDLGRSPLIQELVTPNATMRLYGYSEQGGPPSFARFLAPFDLLRVPGTVRMAYVIIVHLDRGPQCWYGVPFGGGRYLLKDEYVDTESARDVARHATVPADRTQETKVRQVRTKRVGNRILTDQRKSSREGSLGDLYFNPFVEILDEIDGKPLDTDRYGTALTGGRSLVVRKKLSFDDLSNQIGILEQAYIDSQAADQRGAAEAMYTVKDEDLTARLDSELVRKFRDQEDQDIMLSVPDFIRSDDVPEIRFTKFGRGSPVFPDDVQLSTYRELLTEHHRLDGVDLSYLKDAQVLVGSDDLQRRYSVYRCLSALVELDGTFYIHDDSSWYSVPANLLDEVNRQIDDIGLWDGRLPLPNGRVIEPSYNRAVGREFLVMDARVIPAFAGQTPVEICDLLTIHQDMLTLVHVKRDFSSSALSHCFEQGRVSAMMFQESEPRARFQERIQAVMRRRRLAPPWSRRLNGFLGRNFRPRRTCVVFAILGNWGQRTPSARLPFFSRITLLSAAQSLRGREFEVKLAKVQMPGPGRAPRAH